MLGTEHVEVLHRSSASRMRELARAPWFCGHHGTNIRLTCGHGVISRLCKLWRIGRSS
jgi:hypothetical protein